MKKIIDIECSFCVIHFKPFNFCYWRNKPNSLLAPSTTCLERKYYGTLRLTMLPYPLVSLVLILSVDFSGPEAQVSISVSHYAILEGAHLTLYMVVQGLVIFNVLIMLGDIAFAVYGFIGDYRSGKYDKNKLIEPFIDFMCAGAVVVYVFLMMQSMRGSADSTAQVLQGLEGIPWSNPAMQLQVNSRMRFAHDSFRVFATNAGCSDGDHA
jgi:ABC-type Na+ efflux pump permease subunit